MFFVCEARPSHPTGYRTTERKNAPGAGRGGRYAFSTIKLRPRRRSLGNFLGCQRPPPPSLGWGDTTDKTHSNTKKCPLRTAQKHIHPQVYRDQYIYIHAKTPLPYPVRIASETVFIPLFHKITCQLCRPRLPSPKMRTGGIQTAVVQQQ